MTNTIALLAYDSKKDNLVEFVKKHQVVLSRYKLVAPEDTAQYLLQEAVIEINSVLPISLGGDAQIAAEIATGNIIAVICLVDYLFSQSYEPDLKLLLRICQVHNVPIAINIATAEIIINSLIQATVAHLIFNPVSGQGNAQQELSLIKSLLEPHLHLHIHETTIEQTAEELTKEAIAKQADLIIASGGDGTVSAVAGELVNTGIPLGIIPRGTANAFGMALGIPSITPIRSACDIILAGKIRTIDVGQCNDRTMILLAGVGYEAETIERADREAKNRWGVLAYVMAGWQQLNEQQLFDVEIEIDGVTKTFEAGAITIANAAPPTSVLAQGLGEVIMNDGLLEVMIITSNSRLQAVNTVVRMFGSAIFKTPAQDQDTIGLRTKQVKVSTDPPQKVVLDGEIIGTTPVEIKCIPDGLIVLAPPTNEIEEKSAWSFLSLPTRVKNQALQNDGII
ncbi:MULTISPECIES: methylglyoxal synthase [Okeania]|uniref:Methylglyoxal synthase n=1 Tax=Okeania hirsuta TaxID=1458930 RepID=A0A3N6NVA7_9CYAN|nr:MULTISPECIES: methylglyoxal synthase [Okeania]NEP71423.1 methylglyoxal synthase [Okeania sp. SIO2G5]NEP96085.1 methylglyoxal synthase [Okeania sp. SIO2F5]NEQ89726.1 methylglyoxal synthase [Okeania sp. SIO2G4]NES76225.1 methylglyoxal synthase [Okeania sp. SIO1H4]NES91486.1 methylglyoxal synthase [Okeania sp. SIO2B9]